MGEDSFGFLQVGDQIPMNKYDKLESYPILKRLIVKDISGTQPS